MRSLVELVGVMGADLGKPCEVCRRRLSEHSDGELLFCFSLYAGMSIASREKRRGVERQAHRQVGRVQRAGRRRK